MSELHRADVAFQLLRKYDRPGPRYTSYPTAVEFTEDYTEADYRSRLAEAASERQTSSHPSPPDLESLDESLPTRTSQPMTILSPSMNLYSGTSRLYGAGPLRMRPDAS